MFSIGSIRRHHFTRCASLLALTFLNQSILPSVAFHQGTKSPIPTRNYSSRRNMSNSPSLEIVQFQCLNDNYGYLIHSKDTGETAAVDTPEAGPYQNHLKKNGWKLTHILNTHHHHDHTGANKELKEGGVQVFGPANEKDKIPGIDQAFGDDETFEFGGKTVKVIDVGGHTKGHIAFYFEDDKMVFVGDALFALGCGKMFEGTPMQFWGSLLKLRALPDDTLVYCAHEYTLSNAKFAVSVEPSNEKLMKRFEEIKEAREKGQFTVPTTIGLEKETNPFLRCDTSLEIRKNVGIMSQNELGFAAFAAVRHAKDNFRG